MESARALDASLSGKDLWAGLISSECEISVFCYSAPASIRGQRGAG